MIQDIKIGQVAYFIDTQRDEVRKGTVTEIFTRPDETVIRLGIGTLVSRCFYDKDLFKTKREIPGQ